MNNNEITLNSVVTKSEDQVSTELDGETVLMSIEQGNYYGMDKILSHIWTIIETPIPVSTLCDQLIAEYDVKRDACETDGTKRIKRTCERKSFENIMIIRLFFKLFRLSPYEFLVFLEANFFLTLASLVKLVIPLHRYAPFLGNHMGVIPGRN